MHSLSSIANVLNKFFSYSNHYAFLGLHCIWNSHLTILIIYSVQVCSHATYNFISHI